jgi:hypothetical protein
MKKTRMCDFHKEGRQDQDTFFGEWHGVKGDSLVTVGARLQLSNPLACDCLIILIIIIIMCSLSFFIFIIVIVIC